MENNIHDLMHSGRFYSADPALFEEQTACMQLLYEYNQTRPEECAERVKLLARMFAEVGEGCVLEPPLYANWAGRFVHLGAHVYANFHLTLVDDAEIIIEDYVMFGPNVTLCTANHSIWPEPRLQQAQRNLPIHIHRNVWIGAGTIVLPGVTIGENSVIGAGAVVTHDIPDNVVAYGNPCRVVRSISEEDRLFYQSHL